MSAGRTPKKSHSLGNENTSSSIGLPWPSSQDSQDVEWSHQVKTPPIGVDTVDHYRLSSSVYGTGDASLSNAHHSHDRAKQAATVRYLQAPYLAGSMGNGAGLDCRPTSSVCTFSLASDRHADLLREGESLLASRLVQTATWTGARSLRSSPILRVPEAYLTSTTSSYAISAGANCQQHRLRSFITSPLVAGENRSLDSMPERCATAPLDGSTSLHSTRFLGVRDSDGGRRLIEVGTARAPFSLSAKSSTSRPSLRAIKFVPSHPVTHNMATADATMTEAAMIDPMALPRAPWPAECDVHTRYRRRRDPLLLSACK